MFWLTCWVTDPVQIVKDNIRDAGAVLWPIVERHAWAAAREFTLLDSRAAERAITEWFGNIRLHPAFGTEIRASVLVIQGEQGHRREPPDRIPDEWGHYLRSLWWDDLWERGDRYVLSDRLELPRSAAPEYERDRPLTEERRERRFREFVPLHIYARMDPDLIVDQVTTVQVVVSHPEAGAPRPRAYRRERPGRRRPGTPHPGGGDRPSQPGGGRFGSARAADPGARGAAAGVVRCPGHPPRRSRAVDCGPPGTAATAYDGAASAASRPATGTRPFSVGGHRWRGTGRASGRTAADGPADQ
jgi:hypothetical protein